MVTTQAFNALLKTLEEPPGNIVFHLPTTEYHKIPETILSRCQKCFLQKIPNRPCRAPEAYRAEGKFQQYLTTRLSHIQAADAPCATPSPCWTRSFHFR
jgi:DNA polymerase III delta prime subunit